MTAPQKSPELPRVHKVILSTADMSAGTTANALFTNVNLPHVFQNQAVVMVESWVCQETDAGAAANVVLNLHVDGWHHANSYYSKTHGQTDVLFTTIGYQHYQQCVTNGMSATVVLDPTQLSSKTLNVIIEAPLQPGFAFNNPWVLTLLVYERSASDILS